MAKSDEFLLTPEELRLKRQRQRRRIIVVAAIILSLGVGILLARPARNAIKSWQSRRHATKAFALIDQSKWTEARDEATAAYQLRAQEPQALRAVARLLSRMGQAEALDFWKNLRDVTPLTRDDLRDEAAIALVSGEIERSAASIDALLASDGEQAAPRDWLLAAEFALRQGKPREALADAQKIFAGTAASERERFQATLLQLQASTGGDLSAIAHVQNEAWSRIAELAKGDTDVALDALVLLARRTLGSQRSEVGSQKPDISEQTAESPTADQSATSNQTSGVALADALDHHPLARAPQKLLALDLQMHENASEKEPLIARAIEQWRDADPPSLASLATWLNGKGEYQRTLDVIPLEKAVQTREVFLQHVDALGALARWDEIKRILESERFSLDPVVQRMYLARTNAQLNEKTASENNWQRALEAAGNDVQKLMTVGEYAEKNGALDTAEACYTRAVTEAPRGRPAQQGRLRIAQGKRDTKQIHSVLAEMLNLWPNDSAIQNDEAYTRLLLLPDDIDSADELAAIEEQAEKLVERQPTSLPHRTLLALARLRHHKYTAALETYANVQVAQNALSPSALAVHAAVLSANGHAEEARSEIAKAPTDSLLPEEQSGIANLRE